MASPRNPTLYASVKREAKRRFSRWPSAYGSAWLTREYKRRGGTYKKGSRSGGVSKWMREEWIQVEPYVTRGARVCGFSSRRGARRTHFARFSVRLRLRDHAFGRGWLALLSHTPPPPDRGCFTLRACTPAASGCRARGLQSDPENSTRGAVCACFPLAVKPPAGLLRSPLYV